MHLNKNKHILYNMQSYSQWSHFDVECIQSSVSNNVYVHLDILFFSGPWRRFYRENLKQQKGLVNMWINLTDLLTFCIHTILNVQDILNFDTRFPWSQPHDSLWQIMQALSFFNRKTWRVMFVDIERFVWGVQTLSSFTWHLNELLSV